MAKKNQKTKQLIDKNPIESFKDIGGAMAKAAIDDLGKKSLDQFWAQILGAKEKRQNQDSGDLSEGQELDLLNLKKKTEQTESLLDVLPLIDYRREIINSESKVIQENQRELDTKVEQIAYELKQLINASEELRVQFKEVAVEQRIVKAGKYHVNFLEWVLAIVKTARMKIEDSQNWLSTFKSKKAKKQYWNMFKKHGTTFGLSNERVVSTQTG